MSFKAGCPSCGVKMRFPPEAAGASVECPKCHNYFTAAPPDDAPLPERFRRLPVGAPRAAVAEAPAAETSTFLAGSTLPAQAAPVASDVMVAAPQVNFAGVAAFLCGSAGLLCASMPAVDFLTIPFTGIGLLAGAAGLFSEHERRKGIILAILGEVVCVPVLVLAVFWPQHLTDTFGRGRPGSVSEKTKPLVIPTRGRQITEPPEAAGDESVLAEAAGVRIGNVQVRVLRSAMGSVELTARPEKAPERNLTITIRVANVGTKERVKYTSWGAALRGRAANAPNLRDSRGKNYQLTDFGPGVSVPGRFRGKELLPGKFVNDRLIFPEPVEGAEYFVLELPAGAVGGEGVYKFKILRANIGRDGSGIASGR